MTDNTADLIDDKPVDWQDILEAYSDDLEEAGYLIRVDTRNELVVVEKIESLGSIASGPDVARFETPGEFRTWADPIVDGRTEEPHPHQGDIDRMRAILDAYEAHPNLAPMHFTVTGGGGGIPNLAAMKAAFPELEPTSYNSYYGLSSSVLDTYVSFASLTPIHTAHPLTVAERATLLDLGIEPRL